MEKEGVREEVDQENKKECEVVVIENENYVKGIHDQQQVNKSYENREFNVSKLQTLNPTNPLRIVIQGAHQSHQVPTPSPPQPLRVSTTPQQPSLSSLNSRKFTNRISLFIFLLHTVVAIGLVCFLGYKAVQGILKEGSIKRREQRVLRYWFPQVECSAIISIFLAFIWQKTLREWPGFMIKFILWSSFATSLSAGILLLCFQKPSTDGVGVALVGYSIGNGLYACWVTRRIGFTTKVITKSLEPITKFPDINYPIYLMMGVGFMWITVWVLAVIGALNFYFPPLVVILLVLSLAWTTEVLRNVANLTVSRVISLYYLRGMQSSTQFCFQRAMSRNLGSACLGSLFVPAIEALRIIARGLNLLEGEDEFMFSCAHCCLRVMESIFRYGNGWAYVQTRIGMAVPHACVSCYYVCYAENPENRLFDKTIPDRINFINSGRDVLVQTPRVPRNL
ncbi:hypothetical protein AQUCO_00900345v1 [Aquilegia coerulea]|uniref:Choline transporter-like protein n=1 Tax=Aquilegia coerulea TaxID=218851 RepID=A0A2G5ED62_AQUCA|nr:hypothetical protein AQUCO_00900345v1 [Aquilegia coerulea]